MKSIPIIITGILTVEDDEDMDKLLNWVFEEVSTSVGLLELEVKVDKEKA